MFSVEEYILSQVFSQISKEYLISGIAKYDLQDYHNAIADINKAINCQPSYSELYCLSGLVKGKISV